VPGLSQDLDADIGVTRTAALLTTAWQDQSGRGFNATAGTGALGLLYAAEDVRFAGHASVTFNGTNDFMNAHGVSAILTGTATPFYIVQVLRHVTLPAGATAMWSLTRNSSGVPFQYLRTAGAIYGAIRRNDAATLTQFGSASVANTTQSHIVETVYDGNLVTVSIDGTVRINAQVWGGGALTADQFSIGAFLTGATPSFFGTFALTRHLVYNNVPSAADQTWLRAYLKARYQTP